ncbi:YadA-like family protein [Sneathia sanguinegens]|uniref:YadA-like family protein n=1 Tax=Sneathia sanguinegens TaxID=40543 RepID=UPI0023F98515|nr:YadA-like family protein [Sneathia sanguinegens]
MNKINIEEMKRYLKRSLKKKIKITTSLIVLFMMSNSIGLATAITIDSGKIGSWGSENTSKGSIALNPKGEIDSKVQYQKVKDYSIAIGLGAEADSSDSVSIGHSSVVENNAAKAIAIGNNAKVYNTVLPNGEINNNSIAIGTGAESYIFKSVAIGEGAQTLSVDFYNDGTRDDNKRKKGDGGQSTAIGSGAVAVDQATSVGNDTYAIGRSSIAIGSDDNRKFREETTPYDFNKYFKNLYDKIGNSDGHKYGAKNGLFAKFHENDFSYNYSPTLSAGEGGIALGTRALSYGTGATSIGAMSFALGDYSTAMGAKTRAEGEGAIAIGNSTKVFSNHSVAVGNENQILNEGGTAYGYKAYSGGKNSIAIGTEVYSNTILSDDTKGIHSDFIGKYTGKDNGTIFSNDYMNGKISDVLEAKENKLKESGSLSVNKKALHDINNIIEGKDNNNNSIVLGTKSMATESNSIALGHGTFSLSKNSMAFGSFSYVKGDNSLGLGVDSKILSNNSIAIGTRAGVGYNSANSLVMGNFSYSTGENALVFGNKSKVTAKDGLAIGSNSEASLANSTALGVNSKTDYTKEDLEKDGYAPRGVLSMPSTEKIGVISVGSKGAERRIVNVAAGYRDTDAVNVSQLKAMEEKINQSGLMDVEDDDLNISDNGIHYLSVDKNGYRSKDIKEIMQKQRDYNKYIEYKSRQLEMKAREARGDQLPDSYKTKINAKVENLEKKYENDTQFNQIELKKITDQEIEKIKNNGVSFDSIITKINLAKEKDKYITYTDENGQEIQKLKTILYEDEVKKINESNYNNKGAIGKDSIALGYQTKSTGDKGIAIGTGDQRSLDILENQKIIDITRGEEKQKLVNKEVKLNNNMYTRSGENAVAVGTGAIAKDWSVALGGNTQTEDTAVAIGDRSKALGNRSIAIGNKAATGRYYEFNGKEKINETLKKLNGQTLNYDSIGMVGYDGAEKAIAIGSHSTATSDYSVAIGDGATTGDDKNTKEIYVKDRTKNDLTESEQAMIIRKHFHKDENSFNQDEKNRLQSLIKDYELKNLDRQKQEILEKNYYLKENEVNKDANKKKIFDELVRSINAKTEQEKKDAKEKILQKYFHKNESELSSKEKIEFQKKVSNVQVDNKEMILQKYFAKSKYDQLSSEEKKDFDKLIKDLTDSEKENLLRTYFMGKKYEELTPAEKAEFDDFKNKFKKKVKIGGAENAIAIGKYAKASKNDTIALGKDSNAVGEKAIAIGKESKANGSQSVVIGTPNSSNNKTDENTDSNIGEISAGTSSVSVGNGVKSGNYSVGIGGNVVAGYTAVAIGDRSRAIGDTSVAIGEKALAKGPRSIAIGNETKANAEDSYIFGGKSEISQTASQSSAIGINITVKSAQAIAMGNDVLIDENSRGAVAIGSDDSSYNEGNNKIGGNYTKTIAKGNATTAIGAHAQATNIAATALGARAFATEKETVAVGANSKASVEGAVAIGSYSLADQQKNTTYYNPKTGDTDGKDKDKLATKAALSIGDTSKNIRRQLIGLAAGTNDTDAVNVWQLKELKGYFDENKKFKLEGDKNGEQTLELPNKLEVKGNTEKKNDGKTYQDWDSTYTVENVQTHISKSGNNAKVLIGIKNKPRFDKVYVGSETTGLEIAQDNNSNITLKQKEATLTLTKDNNNFKMSGIANGVADNDAVAYGQVKNPFIVKADKSTPKASTEKSMSLGKTLEFTGRKFDGTKNYDDWSVDEKVTGKSGNYTSENVETFVTQDNNTGRTGVLIGLRKEPRFDKVTLGELDNDRTEITKDGISITKKGTPDKVAKLGIDNEGNATLTDARNTTASPIVTEKSLGDQKISYAANSENKKETTLTKGFNFSDGINTKAEIGDNGVVKFNLKDKLTGITSITNGNEDNANENSKIELKNEKLILINKGKSVKILTKGTNGNEETLIEFERPVKNETSSGKPSINPKHEDYGIGTINYLKDRRASKDNDYGTGTNIGRAATEGAVKEVYNKINVVYTDSEGNRLVKANDGEYYKAEDVEATGEVKKDKQKATEIKATLVNPDGSTTTPTTVLRVADGSIAADSKDAINGGQLKTELDKKLNSSTYETDKQTFVTKTELKDSKVEVEGTKDEIVVTPGTKADGKGTKYIVKLDDTLKTKIDGALQTSTAESTYAKKDASNITEAKWVEKLGDTSLENGTKLAKSSAVKEYVDKIKSGLEDKGLKFTADNAADNLVKLGETLSIVGRSGENNQEVKTWKHGPNDQQDKQEDYTTENVTTHYEKTTDGKQQIFVGIKEKPTFKKITLKDGETKQVDLTPTKDGLSLNGKKLTGLEAGTENTDAINKKQFDDALANKANSTDLNSYAKVDASNLDENNVTTNRDKWINKLGVTSINKNTTDNSKNGKLTTEKAVVDYVKQEIDTVNKNIGNNTIAYKANSGDSKTTTLTTGFDFTSKDLEITTENDGKVTFNLTDTVKNSLNGKGNDGRDGKSGTGSAGLTGLTGKDGLNGKDLTTKVNALRNGEAGTVVYTDKDGNRLVKANDGEYYKAEDVEATGEVKKDKQKATEIKATLVNPDGSTTTPTTVLRVADGSIAADSKDAINGGQLKTELDKKLNSSTYETDKQTFVTKTELKDSKVEVEGTKDEIVVTPGTKADGKGTKYIVKLDDTLKTKIDGALQTSTAESTYAKVDGSNITGLDDTKKKAWATGIGASSIDAKTTKDQLVTDSAVKTYVDGKGLKFGGNTGDESEVSLGNKLSIIGEGDKVPTETAENNITVVSDKENKKLTVKLAKDLQNIGSVTFKQGDKTTKINIDDSGDLNITKNGNTKVEKILTTNNIGGQKISYKGSSDTKVNGIINSKETTLTTGFDFTSDDLEITTENDGKVTFNLTDTVKNSLNGKGNDGRDGKSGTGSAGLTGLTGKDGLNGKDLTTKVNAIRNGEAGTVVYTDSEGNRLVKDNKGDYYKAGDVEDNGNAKQGKQKVTEIKATLVNPDGTTNKPTTVLRVADGSIAKDSKDAINGGQLNNLGYMLGLEVNGKNTGFKAPKITDLKGTNTTPANILDGLNQTREHINKGLTFEANYNADGYGASSLNRIFGETLSITASGAENGKYVGKDNSNYTGDNLATYVKQGKFYIGMKETPTFKSINIGSTGFGEHQTDKGKGDITADNEGLKLSYDNASVTIAKDGDKAKLSGLKDANVEENTYGTAGVAATQKEVKDVLNKINANGTEQAKLKNGTLGTVVYTDKDGNKLMKDTDGKFYKAQADGTKEENAKEVVPEDVILSTVKPDGKTTEPITLGNVASALGLSKDKKDKNNEILNKLVNKKAEEVYKDAELNKVVTLRDLQFLASKGITFAGSTGTATKFLGDTITINGTASNYNGLDNNNFATKYETKNIAVKVDNNTGNIEVGLAKELKAIESIENKETKVTLTEKGTEFKTGADGVTTKIGKDGIEITKQGGQNPSVSIKAGDTTNGPSIDFATTSADNKTVGTGSITGLKDLDNNSDGHMAANKNYVDEKVKTITGDIEKLKNKGLKFAGNTGETKELNDKVNIKGEGTEANNFESAKGNINVVAKESNVELQLSANLKNMKSFEAKDDKGNTVNITGDKIEFKKNNKSTLTINSDGTITGLKTNSSPFEYYEKNKDTVFAKDGTEYKAGTIVTEAGKVYAKGTQEVEGKYFAEGDNVVKAKDGKFYKEKDIKDRTYDEATKKWSGDSAQPTEATEAKALEGNELKNAKAEDKVVVKGKDNKFYEASDFEKAVYDEAKNEYTKDGKKLEGKEAKDVVIKALPNNEAMTLSNIANARLVKDSKDAVNAGQMLEELDKKMNKDGSNIDKKEFANNISEGANITKPEGILVTDKQVNEHLNKNYYNKTEVDAKVSNISNTVVEANKKSDLALGGVANAVAMANLLQANSYSKYKTNISAAYGYYGGSNALAIGFSGVSENRMVSYRVSGSVNTKGNIALGAGLGVMLGEFKTDKYPEKGKKISELEEKLRLQTEKTNKLEKQLEEILKLLKK